MHLGEAALTQHPPLDLNLLRVLSVFATERSVLASARKLGLTPSAVSQALRRLEKETGLQLFLRSHKKLVLTREGGELLRVTVPLLQQTEETLSSLSRNKSIPRGTIRVGAPVEFATNFLIPVFSRFAESHPEISLSLTLGSPGTLISGLLSGELDLAYCDDGPYFAEHRAVLSTAPAFHETLILACSRRFHDRYLSEGISFKTLIALRHLDYIHDHSAVNIWYQHHFKRPAARLNLSLVSENVNALIQGVRNHLGLAMIPSYLVRNELERGDLVSITTGHPELRNRILLVQHQNRITPVREKLLLAFVKKNELKFHG